MSFWVLLQVLANIVFLVAIAILWIKVHRPPKDDPRLSRGLQILQSKISVLEDLSDRTDTQANQLIAIMEQKVKELQAQVVQSEKQMLKIEQSMGKSLEVAKIFQDKIPHQEIIERQNTLKYIKAARLAHAGASVEEIASEVDLAQGEIELIAKVNRDRLQFSEEDLPEWAHENGSQQFSVSNFEVEKPPALRVEEEKKKNEEHLTLSLLGDKFRKAIPSQTQVEAQAPKKPESTGGIRKVVFPKIQVNDNLS